MTYRLTLLSWVPIGAGRMARDWCRMGVKACWWACWCMWKCRWGRQGTYEVESWDQACFEIVSRQGGRCRAGVCGLTRWAPSLDFPGDWIQLWKLFSPDFQFEVWRSLCMYVCYLFTSGYSMLELYDFALAPQIKHWAGASFPRSNGNLKMWWFWSYEDVFLPLISRQIYEHLFVMDMISPESHAKRKKICVSCLSHEIQ